MTITRISTYATHQNTLRDVNRTQVNMYDLQNQLSSGLKTDSFAGLNQQVEHFVALEAKIRKSESYVQNNEMILSRLNTTQKTLENAIDVADQVENLIALRRSSVSGEVTFGQNVKDLRDTMTQLLNTTFEGRFLFGGTRTDVAPVKENPLPLPVEYGTPDDTYYQGSKEDLTVRIQDNQQITYNVRADDPAFQKIYAAFALAIKGDTDKDNTMLADAMDMLQTGMNELIAVQAGVNSNIVNITSINERHADLKLYWKGVKDEIITTDIVAVSTEVATNQAVLQATFQSFARINQLRLTDYL
jgi:flagellar hook-associated protein 3 FlgL